ncbi:MAG: nitroreductase family protein [Actinomycetota bacterium]|nr:nitroreductase family protein [Actinomycetota bacterium]
MIDFFDVVLSQRACRSFTDRPVPDDVIERVLTAATHAPSAENIQPWALIVVRAPELRSRIGELTRHAWQEGGRQFSADRLTPSMLEDVDRGALGGVSAAPVLIVVCGDTSRCVPAVLEASIWPAVQNLLLAATASGLGSALTTLATRFGAELRGVLGLPEHVRAMAVIPLGHPAKELGPPKRLPLSERAHRDHYGTAW